MKKDALRVSDDKEKYRMILHVKNIHGREDGQFVQMKVHQFIQEFLNDRHYAFFSMIIPEKTHKDYKNMLKRVM